MDVVIPLGTGSRYNNFELRMCLRGIEKNLTGVRDIWVIGEFPSFLVNVNHLPHEEKGERVPDRNIFRKIKQACECPEISDPFIMLNDDHYLLQPFEAESFPYYYSMTLETYIKGRYKDPYGKRALNTYKALGHVTEPLFYDTHTPIVIHKQTYLEKVATIDWDKSYDGYLVKSLYANQANVTGVQLRDRKSQEPQPDAKVFSSHPIVKASVQHFLMYTFPHQSKWEKDNIGKKAIK